jgi:hypothetical protein
MRLLTLVSFVLPFLVLAVPPAHANATQSRICTPTEVAVLESRIHVKCQPIADQASTKDIIYFAVSRKADANLADQILQVLLAAKSSRQNLRVWFDPKDYSSVPGCQGNDCRRLHAVAIQ